MATSLLADVEAFIKASGMSASDVGSFLVNDTHLVRQLRAGRDPKESTCIRVREKIETWRMKNAENETETAAARAG